MKKTFHQFNVNNTIRWFEERGVELKTESDNRMFPVSNRSQTIIDCLVKEAQDQGVVYTPEIKNIRGCGYYFPFPVPSDSVLCAMKATALLERGKGRDFYDLMFLLGQTKPDYDFLAKRTGIKNASELKVEVKKRLKSIDLKTKTKDFEHLLFNKENNKRILRFEEFFEETV